MPHKVLDPTTAAFVPALGLAEPADDALTLADFRSRLTKRTGNRDDQPTADLDGYINEAILDIASAIDIPTLSDILDFTVVADQDLYQTETSIAWIESASVVGTSLTAGDGWPLLSIDLRAYRRMPDSTGTPTHIMLHGNNLIALYPTPTADRIVSADVRILPPRLESDGDQSILGVEWDRGILLKARAILFESVGEYAASQIAENNYINFVRTRINTKAERRTGQLGGMRPIRDAWQLRSTRPPILEPGDG